ncbi:hypothetical protein FF38_02850 [Lucilia cuprina]|uniref:Uncharacterized protein n=1 Tax=Lucilia cuprina TaxID=7375 RepID=A0A0L0CGJ1_LUCCU|nr:hypothetical protein FF38_02850 [Lucilia cuprina]
MNQYKTLVLLSMTMVCYSFPLVEHYNEYSHPYSGSFKNSTVVLYDKDVEVLKTFMGLVNQLMEKKQADKKGNSMRNNTVEASIQRKDDNMASTTERSLESPIDSSTLSPFVKLMLKSGLLSNAKDSKSTSLMSKDYDSSNYKSTIDEERNIFPSKIDDNLHNNSLQTSPEIKENLSSFNKVKESDQQTSDLREQSFPKERQQSLPSYNDREHQRQEFFKLQRTSTPSNSIDSIRQSSVNTEASYPSYNDREHQRQEFSKFPRTSIPSNNIDSIGQSSVNTEASYLSTNFDNSLQKSSDSKSQSFPTYDGISTTSQQSSVDKDPSLTLANGQLSSQTKGSIATFISTTENTAQHLFDTQGRLFPSNNDKNTEYRNTPFPLNYGEQFRQQSSFPSYKGNATPSKQSAGIKDPSLPLDNRQFSSHTGGPTLASVSATEKTQPQLLDVQGSLQLPYNNGRNSGKQIERFHQQTSFPSYKGNATPSKQSAGFKHPSYPLNNGQFSSHTRGPLLSSISATEKPHLLDAQGKFFPSNIGRNTGKPGEQFPQQTSFSSYNGNATPSQLPPGGTYTTLLDDHGSSEGNTGQPDEHFSQKTSNARLRSYLSINDDQNEKTIVIRERLADPTDKNRPYLQALNDLGVMSQPLKTRNLFETRGRSYPLQQNQDTIRQPFYSESSGNSLLQKQVFEAQSFPSYSKRNFPSDHEVPTNNGAIFRQETFNATPVSLLSKNDSIDKEMSDIAKRFAGLYKRDNSRENLLNFREQFHRQTLANGGSFTSSFNSINPQQTNPLPHLTGTSSSNKTPPLLTPLMKELLRKRLLNHNIDLDDIPEDHIKQSLAAVIQPHNNEVNSLKSAASDQRADPRSEISSHFNYLQIPNQKLKALENSLVKPLNLPPLLSPPNTFDIQAKSLLPKKDDTHSSYSQNPSSPALTVPPYIREIITNHLNSRNNDITNEPKQKFDDQPKEPSAKDQYTSKNSSESSQPDNTTKTTTTTISYTSQAPSTVSISSTTSSPSSSLPDFINQILKSEKISNINFNKETLDASQNFSSNRTSNNPTSTTSSTTTPSMEQSSLLETVTLSPLMKELLRSSRDSNDEKSEDIPILDFSKTSLAELKNGLNNSTTTNTIHKEVSQASKKRNFANKVWELVANDRY